MNLVTSQLPASRWLDLCSGSGVMGCEALKRGASLVFAVERDKKTSRICEANLQATSKGLDHAHKIRIIHQDLLKWLRVGRTTQSLHCKDIETEGFNLVYLDPPYRSRIYEPTLHALHQGDWLKKNAVVVCEHNVELMFKPPQGWQQLDHRIYGSSAILLLSPPGHYLACTDSKPLQIGPTM